MLSDVVEQDGNCIVGSVKGFRILCHSSPLVELMFFSINYIFNKKYQFYFIFML